MTVIKNKITENQDIGIKIETLKKLYYYDINT